MIRAYIALGSNIAPREQYLTEAMTMLREHDSIIICTTSKVYETAPVGYVDQNDFLNMVVEIETGLQPLALLDYCQSIEQKLGRKRTIKWGPRTIDLDILLYNEENMKAERLTIPHPHMHERAFVIVPLAEVNPGAYLPSLNQTVEEILQQLPEDEVKSIQPLRQL
ncbi:2-amino-4-hydroxy-6-hydroxymethyldihydropteridine diphosphokinase [Halobacillus shinanisalinarum]|uniref:2-amino-4-hydroxy-6-hydroxymethyldihydropteridine diphosphokinase n=1 Tax=Halobacillus shinanisalinarum TaxID=2932258 RepID=A0ABY4GTB8_9BACI|nr:2-amino-4-hydroxy-6-hydroxymethyldihydropteridine diphosphokinase [Halobacillus shinanisalinarum]UOQ91378.1 2-amino-4-hydroxy-6-hydroxymethyldihydropteridine diphosphokinase [Halobacillus shinanisalinarum]